MGKIRNGREKLKTHQVFKINQDTNQPPTLIKVLGCIFISFYILSQYSATKSLSTAHISGDDGAPQGRHGDKTNKVRVNTAPLIGQRPSADADTGL